MWFCLWTFATLLAAAIKTNTDTNRNIDPQQIVIIALWVFPDTSHVILLILLSAKWPDCSLYFLVSCSSHTCDLSYWIYQLLIPWMYLEWKNVRRQFCLAFIPVASWGMFHITSAFRVFDDATFMSYRAKSTTKRQWDEEWGSIATEGNIWWLGSYKKNWEAVMGHKILEWFRKWSSISSGKISWREVRVKSPLDTAMEMASPIMSIHGSTKTEDGDPGESGPQNYSDRFTFLSLHDPPVFLSYRTTPSIPRGIFFLRMTLWSRGLDIGQVI